MVDAAPRWLRMYSCPRRAGPPHKGAKLRQLQRRSQLLCVLTWLTRLVSMMQHTFRSLEPPSARGVDEGSMRDGCVQGVAAGRVPARTVSSLSRTFAVFCSLSPPRSPVVRFSPTLLRSPACVLPHRLVVHTHPHSFRTSSGRALAPPSPLACRSFTRPSKGEPRILLPSLSHSHIAGPRRRASRRRADRSDTDPLSTRDARFDLLSPLFLRPHSLV